VELEALTDHGTKPIRMRSILLFFILSLNGCSQIKKMMNKPEDIRKSLISHCECDDVRLISYQMENLVTIAQYEIVGSNFKSAVEEAQRLKGFLENETYDFCDIDQFTFDFINEENHKYVVMRKCVIQ